MSDRHSKIAVCMIVKDGERTLEVALGSVRAHVDEVNVYDTGSTDETFALLDRLSREVPVLADLKPSGRFTAVDMHSAGGSRLLAKRMIEGGWIDGSAQTVTGRPISAEAETAHGPIERNDSIDGSGLSGASSERSR